MSTSDTSYDEFCDVEFSKVDIDILMSFLEESEIEESNEERIRSVIQSLEAEIAPVLITDSNSLKHIEADCHESNDFHLCDIIANEEESCSTSFDLEFEWTDSVMEFIDTRDFSQMYDRVLLMEDHSHRTSFWEETCESMLYE
ncbi:hypothetical protein A4A49_03143 [Nicotiana attenuata]|uniref:Uncharacterized protein n=1 Tax=Nicotiana attenuata TaxID=49451 RepID=A0A1J6IG35_NICAT|nr:hypothetical protein A4A49_03143 [Nicotiana attenuata]